MCLVYIEFQIGVKKKKHKYCLSAFTEDHGFCPWGSIGNKFVTVMTTVFPSRNWHPPLLFLIFGGIVMIEDNFYIYMLKPGGYSVITEIFTGFLF